VTEIRISRNVDPNDYYRCEDIRVRHNFSDISCSLPIVPNYWGLNYFSVKIVNSYGASEPYSTYLYYAANIFPTGGSTGASSSSSSTGSQPSSSSLSATPNPLVPSVSQVIGCQNNQQCYFNYRISMIGQNINTRVTEIRVMLDRNSDPRDYYMCTNIEKGQYDNEISCLLPSVPFSWFTYYFNIVLINNFGEAAPFHTGMFYSNKVSSTASQFFPIDNSSSSSSSTVSLTGWLMIGSTILIVLTIISCVSWMFCIKRSVNIFARRSPPMVMSESLLVAADHRSENSAAVSDSDPMLEFSSYSPPMPSNIYPTRYANPSIV
jgi:hypothetical protein